MYQRGGKTIHRCSILLLEPTEKTTSALIKQLIDRGIAVMALSTRSLFIAERTLEQLDQINIHFFIPTINTDELVLPMPHPFYREGFPWQAGISRVAQSFRIP